MEIILTIQKSNFFKSHGVASRGWESEETEHVLIVDAHHIETMTVYKRFLIEFPQWRIVGVHERKVEGLMNTALLFLTEEA